MYSKNQSINWWFIRPSKYNTIQYFFFAYFTVLPRDALWLWCKARYCDCMLSVRLCVTLVDQEWTT